MGAIELERTRLQAAPQGLPFSSFIQGGLSAVRMGYTISLSLHSFAQVNVPIQLGSQVLPPSVENACSVRNEFAAASEKTKRTKIDLPWKSSWSKNSPRSVSNCPIVGTCRMASLRLAQ